MLSSMRRLFQNPACILRRRGMVSALWYGPFSFWFYNTLFKYFINNFSVFQYLLSNFFNPIFKSYWNLKILIQKSQNWFEYFDVLIVLNSIRNYITFASLYWAVHIYQLLSITLNRNGENLNLLVITLCRYEWMNQRNTLLLDLQV